MGWEENGIYLWGNVNSVVESVGMVVFCIHYGLTMMMDIEASNVGACANLDGFDTAKFSRY